MTLKQKLLLGKMVIFGLKEVRRREKAEDAIKLIEKEAASDGLTSKIENF